MLLQPNQANTFLNFIGIFSVRFVRWGFFAGFLDNLIKIKVSKNVSQKLRFPDSINISILCHHLENVKPLTRLVYLPFFMCGAPTYIIFFYHSHSTKYMSLKTMQKFTWRLHKPTYFYQPWEEFSVQRLVSRLRFRLPTSHPH